MRHEVGRRRLVASFRGPDGNGIANEQNVPIHFGEKQNVTWKTSIQAVPGPHRSSPTERFG